MLNKKMALAAVLCCLWLLPAQAAKPPKIKNVILMVGDGMGVAQIYAGLTAKRDALNLERCRHIGFSKTTSADNYITDSAAGATAWSIGKKTLNYAIGVDATGTAQPTLVEIAGQNKKSSGVVATCSVTHATPASFVAHQPSRKLDEAIAADFLKSNVDVFIGGGLKYFAERSDNMNLLPALESRGYKIARSQDELWAISEGKVAALVAAKDLPKMSEGRGDYLTKASLKAIELLNKDKDGFFLMIEGSQIDWGGHNQDSDYIVNEMVDFDNAIGAVLDFADKDGQTLVIVTADHETGGYAITGGDMATGKVEGKFIYGKHTGVMVPVFAYGPGADLFMGIYHNNTIFDKILKAWGIKQK